MKVKVIKSNNVVEEVDVAVKEEVVLSEAEVALISRVRNQAQKQGTKSAKTRSEVVGHSAKPFRQKGTGRARQGSTKAPHHVGGGVAHGPKPDFTKLNLNKKFKSLVLKKMLVESIKNDGLSFVDVKGANKGLRKAVGNDVRTLVVLNKENNDAIKFLRNLSNVDVLRWDQLSSFNLLNFKNILVDSDCKDELVNLLNK